ncbi:MAG: serine/threonine-protein kinase [Myxococcota bacterium]
MMPERQTAVPNSHALLQDRAAGLGRVALTAVVAAVYQLLIAVGLASLAARIAGGLRREARDARCLGQYTLGRKLGEGGNGVIFRATHATLERPSAIKLLRTECVSLDAQARFHREAQLTAKLSHPHTVRVLDYGETPDGLLYYAMELLDGATLREIVESAGPQTPARVVHILQHTALALGEAHSLGLVHRDVKPSNIMLARQGGEFDVTKVLDFGLVKATAVDAENLTQANAVVGTPRYLSPEAIRAPKEVCPRSDLYSLGAVGYYLVTGRHAFDAETVVEVCAQHLTSTPRPPTQVTGEPIPPELESIIMTCLEKNPNDRPASGRAMAEALERVKVPRWSRDDAEAWWGQFGQRIDLGSRNEPATEQAPRAHAEDDRKVVRPTRNAVSVVQGW